MGRAANHPRHDSFELSHPLCQPVQRYKRNRLHDFTVLPHQRRSCHLIRRVSEEAAATSKVGTRRSPPAAGHPCRAAQGASEILSLFQTLERDETLPRQPSLAKCAGVFLLSRILFEPPRTLPSQRTPVPPAEPGKETRHTLSHPRNRSSTTPSVTNSQTWPISGSLQVGNLQASLEEQYRRGKKSSQ